MLKHLSITFGTSVAILVFNVLGGVLTARLLGPEGKGELTAVTLWPSILAAIGSLGMVEAIVYFTGRERDDNAFSIISSALIAMLVQSVVLIIVGLIIIPLLLRQYPASIVTISLGYVIYIPLNLGTMYALAIAQGKLQLGRYNLIRFFLPTSYVVGILVLALLHQVTVVACVIVLLLSNLLGLIFSILSVLRDGQLKLVFQYTHLRKMLSYGIKAHIGNLSSLLNLRLDQMLMAVLLSPRMLGLYVVAVTVGNGVNLVSTAMAMVTFPTISQSKEQGDDKFRYLSLARFLRINLWLAGAVSVVLILSASWLMPLLFGVDYVESIAPMQVLAAAAVVAGMNAVMAAGVKGLGRPIISTYGELAGLAATAVFLFLLLPRWQIMGAAVASLLAYSTTFIVMFGFVWRRLGISPRLLIQWQPEDRLTLQRLLQRRL